MNVVERTITHDDLLNAASRWGKLYLITRGHSNKWIAQRLRRRGEQLVQTSERLTLEQSRDSRLPVSIGDYAFIDNGPTPTWSLWKKGHTYER